MTNIYTIACSFPLSVSQVIGAETASGEVRRSGKQL